VNDSSTKQFGLMVAYLLPGFVALTGLAPFAPVVAAWLQSGEQTQAGLGPPVYAVLAATTIGMVVSCFRWLIVDQIHRMTGIVPPLWDDSRLDQRLSAFDYLVESHYRYYQFVANMIVAIVAAYLPNRLMHTSPLLGVASDVAVMILCIALFAASRNALSKYYLRTARLIGHVDPTPFKESAMHNYNGNDKLHPARPTPPTPEEKPPIVPTTPSRPESEKPTTSNSSK
jgi:hypothetical protein